MMKMVWIFVLASALQVAAGNTKSYSQATRLNLKMKNASLESVIWSIKKQSEFNFFYNSEDVKEVKNIDVDLKDATAEEILLTVLDGTGLTFDIVHKAIIIREDLRLRPKSMERLDVQQPDGKMLTGTVTDTDGQPLPGVTVILKGTTTGTVTNADGNYSISNIPEDATLVFSFVGMRTQEVVVGVQTSIDVVMEVDAIGIEEVVAIGYGTARRNDISGSVNTVRVEDSPIANAPNINALSALKGVSTGLNVGTINTAGGIPDILIRGQNSISGSNDPLIVLDGSIYLGSFGDINPNDIATFDILKDASSTAVFGSRAANGVIIITTKKGKTEKPTIRLKSSTYINVWQQRGAELESPERYLQRMMDRYDVDDPLDIQVWEDYERKNFLAGKTTDWLDLVSRVGISQNHSLAVSGKGKRMNYYLSTGYVDEKGVIVGDDFQQVTMKVKLDTDITDWLQIGIDGSYSFRDASGLGANLGVAWYMPPYTTLYFDEENKILEKYPRDRSLTNPLWNTDKSRVEDLNYQNSYRVNGFIKIDIPYIEGLSYRLNYARGSQLTRTETFYNEGYYVDERFATSFEDDTRYTDEALFNKLSSAQGFMGRTNNYNYVFDNIINYNRQFESHYLDITLVATRDYLQNKYIQINGSNFAANGNTILGANGLHKAEVQNYNISVVERSNIGYLGRISYSFNDRYHLTATYRRDGASVFGVDKKWGDFPSVGLAWTASEENFLQSISFVDYLKFKLSYGKNGNQGISPYGTLSQVNSGRDGGIMYEFGDDPSKVLYGMTISSLGNSELGWETTTSFNTGLESALMDNRMFLNVDVYFSETTDQLFVRNIPIMTGFSSINSSMGQVNNHGIEISLSTVNINNQNLTWKSSLTFWQNRNILDQLYGDDMDGDGVEDDDIGNSLFIGKSLGAIYGYVFNGIVQEDDTEYISNTGAKPGDVKFMDLSGPDGEPDGLISASYDRKILGYTKENFRLNLSNTLNIKDFEFYVLIVGIFGGSKDNFYMLDNQNAFRMGSYGDRTELNIPYWTPENRNDSYPSSTYFDERYMGIQSRTFVKIQDVILSYSFNQPWVKKLNINSLKVYSAIKNLYTFTGWVGGDPEGEVRAMQGTYPVPAIYSLGLDIGF